MKKKGFTLIELLAVIVVLAVIALIATPIVTRTIENSKRGAAIESVSNMIKTAELYFITSDPKYGKINLLDENLNYSGQKPELGEVELNKDGHARIYAYVNGYCVTKEFDTELYASKMNKEDCDWFATDNYETTEGTTFTLNNQTIKNYLIYGNSTQETRSGKNLFNPSAWSTKATANGLTVQYLEDEDCFLINGTATQNDIVVEKRVNISSLANTSYVLSTRYVSGSVDRTNGGGSKWAVAYFGNGDTIDTNNNWYAINLQNEDSVTTSKINDKSYITRFWFYVNKGVTFNDYKVKIQLEEGTSATSYEKYGVMPSPEFPSEVKSTGDLLTSSNCASYGSDACNNVGKYVIQVKNSSKNILNINTSDVTLNYTNSMIEEGTTLSNYESYVEPKTTNIYLDEPLRKVGDYADYIDFNEKKVVRNIKEISLNNLSWAKTGNAFYSSVIDDVADEINSTKIKSDKFTVQAKTTNNSMYINHKKVYVWNSNYSDVSQFKSIINNSKLYYVLTTPQEQLVDLPNIELLDGSSTLSINTSVSPSNVRLTTNK